MFKVKSNEKLFIRLLYVSPEAGLRAAIYAILDGSLIRSPSLNLPFSSVWLTFKKETVSCRTCMRLGQDVEQALGLNCRGELIRDKKTPSLQAFDIYMSLKQQMRVCICFFRLAPICYTVRDLLKKCSVQYCIILYCAVRYSYWTGWKLRLELNERDTDVHCFYGDF